MSFYCFSCSEGLEMSKSFELFPETGGLSFFANAAPRFLVKS